MARKTKAQQALAAPETSLSNDDYYKNGSYVLFAIGTIMLVVSQVYFLLSGWVTEFSKLPPKTGIFVLDLLIEFFPAVMRNPSSKVIYDLIGGLALAASSLVVFEGSRRRGPQVNFSQKWLAWYWTIAQFVAIGFATPLYLGWLLQQQPVIKNEKDFVYVGSFRAYSVVIVLLLTGILNVEIERTVLETGLVDPSLLIGWLLLPVIGVSAAIYLDKSTSSPTAQKGTYGVLLTYAMSFFVGAGGYFRVLLLLLSNQFSLNDLLTNPPAVFLAMDLMGVMVGSFYWLYKDGRISITHNWPLLFLFGPGAYLSYLCFLRDRQIDAILDGEA